MEAEYSSESGVEFVIAFVAALLWHLNGVSSIPHPLHPVPTYSASTKRFEAMNLKVL
jgi:hypothetical protein